MTGTFDAPTTYTYNGDGLRASITNSGLTTQETWSGGSGLPLLLAETSGGVSTDYLYGPGGMPIEQIEPNQAVYYLYHDALGSTRAVADAAGNVLATYTYDPYGTMTASTGSFSTSLGYAGQVHDSWTGLLYLRARYNDSATGQFLTRDPLVAATHEPYAYTNANPLNLGDADGLGWCPLGHNPDGSCRGHNATNDVHFVHAVASDVNAVASVCTLALAATPVGPVCGVASLVSAATEGLTGSYLYSQGDETSSQLLNDGITAFLSGAGSVFGEVAKAGQSLSESSRALSYLVSLGEDSDFAGSKLAPASSSTWLMLKSLAFGGLAVASRIIERLSGVGSLLAGRRLSSSASLSGCP